LKIKNQKLQFLTKIHEGGEVLTRCMIFLHFNLPSLKVLNVLSNISACFSYKFPFKRDTKTFITTHQFLLMLTFKMQRNY